MLDPLSRVIVMFYLGCLTLAQVVAELLNMAGLNNDEYIRLVKQLKESKRN